MERMRLCDLEVQLNTKLKRREFMRKGFVALTGLGVASEVFGAASAIYHDRQMELELASKNPKPATERSTNSQEQRDALPPGNARNRILEQQYTKDSVFLKSPNKSRLVFLGGLGATMAGLMGHAATVSSENRLLWELLECHQARTTNNSGINGGK